MAGIAADMKAQAERTGIRVVRTLARGLTLELWPGNQDRAWRLRLSRPAVEPSAEEIRIVSAAFEIPTRGSDMVLLPDQSWWLKWPMT